VHFVEIIVWGKVVGRGSFLVRGWDRRGVEALLLRHCATSRKVAGWIPDCVIGIFHRHNPSGRTVTLETTQTLEYQECFLGVKAAGA
jgi:hypothetical protein